MDSNNSQIKKKSERIENSNFILYSLGLLVSLFGSSIYKFAIGLYVLDITGSGLSFAITLVLGIIPMVILNPFAGVLADKVDKKKIVVIMDILNGLLFIIVYLITFKYKLNLTIIYISTFVMTIFTTLFDISFESAIPNIVSKKLLMKVNSTSRIINSSSSILGPVIGGLIFVFVDIRLFIIINGISFIFSGITEMFIDFKYNIQVKNKNETDGKVDFVRDIKEGFNYLVSNKKLVELFTILITVNITNAFAITVPIPYITRNVLKLSSEFYGIIQGSLPVGIIIGALLVKKIKDIMPIKKLIITMSTAVAIIAILIGLPIIWTNIFKDLHYLIYYGILMFSFGVIISCVDIPIAYTLQTTIPDEFRGRVLSIGLSIVKTLVPIAYVISGALINNITPMLISIIGGFILLIFNILYFKHD